MKVIKNSEFIKSDMIEALTMLGFDYVEMNFYRRIETLKDGSQLIIYCEIYDDCVNVNVYKDTEELDTQTFKWPIKFIDYVEKLLKSYNIESIELVPFDAKTKICGMTNVYARTNSRDFADKLIRVKSSNIWSYAFQPRNDKIGDMLIQFKNKQGGPADIYMYYNVPSSLWRRFVAAPSKGHFMWEFIRHVFKYSKLTGDKKTKLANGI